ncbi:hypothetical protein SEA_HONK_67 [Microbacterium phage Honk]|uniref:Uncharacterized protein n=1 Tax=Microbacterium phage Honk TaxID=2836095 RepID=A0A8F3IMT6_9CAUD|nr:hypothetical protein SEA_HONK_67 [Microbacterium phage Honk]
MSPTQLLGAIEQAERDLLATKVEAARLQREANAKHREARHKRDALADLYASALVLTGD